MAIGRSQQKQACATRAPVPDSAGIGTRNGPEFLSKRLRIQEVLQSLSGVFLNCFELAADHVVPEVPHNGCQLMLLAMKVQRALDAGRNREKPHVVVFEHAKGHTLGRKIGY